MYSLRSYLSAVLLALTSFGAVNSRETALKTNLLYDATATVNIGLEQAVAPKWSIDLSGNLNAWNMHDGARWKHWLVQPEVRYWFCQALDGIQGTNVRFVRDYMSDAELNTDNNENENENDNHNNSGSRARTPRRVRR
ncbi:MAG: DUF3575 domain-containing protein [Muribaculaceae bacterium]|nr:DUF3575 domain-containing protein [Muribaculaceae bacterium]